MTVVKTRSVIYAEKRDILKECVNPIQQNQLKLFNYLHQLHQQKYSQGCTTASSTTLFEASPTNTCKPKDSRYPATRTLLQHLVARLHMNYQRQHKTKMMRTSSPMYTFSKLVNHCPQPRYLSTIVKSTSLLILECQLMS